LVVLDHEPHHVDAKSIDSAVEPEAKNVEHGGSHGRVAPVEVGLLLEEGVVVVLDCQYGFA
jgi:hypothetical protein